MEKQEQNQSFISQYKGFMAGSIGGIAQVLTGQPFDIVKVRLQSTDNPNVNMKTIFQDILKDDGLKGFYKGTTAPLVAISVQVSLQFGTFEKIKNYFVKKNQQNGKFYEKNQGMSDIQLAICSGSAGYVQSYASCAIEHVRIKMQTAPKGKYTGTLDCIQKIIAQRGFKGLYRGMVATQYRDVVGNVFYFLPYNYTLDFFKSINPDQNYLTMYQLIGGATAGVFCWISSFPFDVIKSRTQADSLSKPKYTGFIQCTKLTFQELGYKGFAKGIVPCIVRSIFVNAATFGVYEQAKKQIEKFE